VEPEPKQEILSNLDPDEDSLFNRPFLETEEVDGVDDESEDQSTLFTAEEVEESTLFIAHEEDENEDELHPDSLASMFMQNNKNEAEEWSSGDSEKDDVASLFGDDTLTQEDSPYEVTQDSPFETTQDSFFEQDVEEQPEDLSEPVASVSGNESEGGLAKALKKNQKKYIKKLFGGSEADYKEVVETLEGKFVWKNVIKCLQTEIIPTYDIDMTSKIMVQFTDELQKYFTD